MAMPNLTPSRPPAPDRNRNIGELFRGPRRPQSGPNVHKVPCTRCCVSSNMVDQRFRQKVRLERTYRDATSAIIDSTPRCLRPELELDKVEAPTPAQGRPIKKPTTDDINRQTPNIYVKYDGERSWRTQEPRGRNNLKPAAHRTEKHRKTKRHPRTRQKFRDLGPT